MSLAPGLAAASTPAASQPIRGLRLKLVTIALILAPLIQVFDTTIVSIALRQMQGELSVTQDQIAWVLTSCLVTLSVFTPLWGVLGATYGRKPLILIAIVGFTTFALLSGRATSLEEIMVWRALLPLAMSSLLSVYPREDFSVAMAWWGVGMMFGPVFGPTIGGYVAEYHSWRWAFYLNLPLGMIAFVMVAWMVPEGGKRPAASEKVQLFWLCHARHLDRLPAVHSRPRPAARLVRQ